MNVSILHQGWCSWLPVIVFITLIAIIGGCSPEAGVGTGGTVGFINAGVGTGGTGSITITGKVADGYLVNATVFMDRNGNYQMDAGETFATTDANGAYKLIVDPADVGQHPIVALAVKGVTIDRDTNQTIAYSYVLSMPKESVSGTVSSNFISPLTSQLREIMETGIYATMQQAADALRARVGLPAGTDMMADYIVAGNTDMHTAARNIATLMGNQMGQVLGTGGSPATVDVNRYRGMMGAIFSNMSSVSGVTDQSGMSNLNSTMTAALSGMPLMSPGQPYQNMSTAFRGKMGGMDTRAGGMMGR